MTRYYDICIMFVKKEKFVYGKCVMRNRKHIIKITTFIVFFSAVFSGLNFFMQPVWRDWNHYDTIHGFYEQPENTIETVFLGSSVMVNGITPMELYENYGICAYNLGTEQQPVMVSYYWLQEAYRLHSKSLKTVVIDSSMLVRDADKSFYRKAISPMRFSSVKYEAVKAYSSNINERLTYLIPFLEYHSRWNDLGKNDFTKGKSEVCKYTRGYNLSTYTLLDENKYDELKVPDHYIKDIVSKQKLDEEALDYFEKMIDFCEINNIRLVVIKTPRFAWSDASHNSVKEIACQHGLDFIDFNYVPYADEIAFNYATDSADGDHMNYQGAAKLTDWMGKYLVESCKATDVRGDEQYAFLEEDLKKYQENITATVFLKETDNLADYLEDAFQMRDCMTFLAVKGDAAAQLTKEQRAVFAKLGLTRLSELTYGDSYLAVIQGGNIIEEQSQFWDQEAYEAGKTVENRSLIHAAGVTGNKYRYEITSAGVQFGNAASCLIDGEEYFKNKQGMNIAVYNCEKDAIVDSAVFNTSVSPARVLATESALDTALKQGMEYAKLPDTLKNLYLYERRCENHKIAAQLDGNRNEIGIRDFLDAYWGKEDYVIFISATDNAAGILDESVKAAFRRVGLEELSTLNNADSYIAVVDGGKILFEQKGQGGILVSAEDVKYEVVSGIDDSKYRSSIKIDGIEYAEAKKGINIIIYDSQLDTVIDEAVFDQGMVSASALERLKC